MDFTEAYPERCSSVAAVVRAGDSKTLQGLIAGGSSIDIHDNRGWMSLHEAAHSNQLECLNILLAEINKQVVDVNVRTWEGETALFLAATGGHDQIVRQLIACGADPNIPNNEEDSPTLQALAGNHRKCIQLLIKNGADINSQNCSGWSLLHESAHRGYPDILLQLLQAGADVNARDDYGIAPVFTAAQYGQLDCLKILIEHGADADSQASDHATPMYLAAQEGHSHCVEYLLSQGASVTITTQAEERVLPIHVAAFKGNLRCLELLIPKSISCDKMLIPSVRSMTPLLLAAEQGHHLAVKMLIEAGCSPDNGLHRSDQVAEIDSNLLYESPLQCALLAGHRCVVETLLAAKASVCDWSKFNSVNRCLLTLLHPNIEAVQLLMECGASPSCKHVLHDLNSLLIHSDDDQRATGYLTCLVRAGLRIQFNCHGWCIQCKKHSRASAHDLSAMIKLMYGYVDRVQLCKHNVEFLKKQNHWSQIVPLISQPHPLQHLSRVAITEHIGTCHAAKVVPEMHFLPMLLRNYLLYES